MDWTHYTLNDTRLELGQYLWKLPKINIGGIVTDIIWIDSIVVKGNGCLASINLPRFSYWNGYYHSIPNGLMYNKNTNKLIGQEFVAVILKECPFCGNVPSIRWSREAYGGGIIYPSYIFEANSFWIDCNCGMGRCYKTNDLKKLQDKWNQRKL